MTSRLIIAALAAACMAGCSKEATTTTPTTPTSPVTNSLSTRLPKGGSVGRSFITSTAGLISVQLKSTTPSTRVGVALGIPNVTGGAALANCLVSLSVESTGGTTPQISTGAPAGNYCVVVWDLGTLTNAIDVDATIIYP